MKWSNSKVSGEKGQLEKRGGACVEFGSLGFEIITETRGIVILNKRNKRNNLK